jgi:hypothetical protein
MPAIQTTARLEAGVTKRNSQPMNSIDLLGLGAFVLITILFFLVGSRANVFHLLCAVLIGAFVVRTGKHFDPDLLGEWIVMTTGLTLYWFGLVIVRIMLTRSVSLQMLADYAKGERKQTASEGIAGRLNDAEHFGLMRPKESGYELTAFGKLIATIVATSYFVLRIR